MVEIQIRITSLKSNAINFKSMTIFKKIVSLIFNVFPAKSLVISVRYWLKNSNNEKMHVKFIKTNKYASKTLFLATHNTEKEEETSLLIYCHMNKKY